jgi:hypothetical protein
VLGRIRRLIRIGVSLAFLLTCDGVLRRWLTSFADDDEDLTNPEGVKFDIGQDFLRAAMQAGQ